MTFFTNAVIPVFLLLSFSLLQGQTTYNLPITISVDQTIVNKYILLEYNKQDFLKSRSEVQNGVTYTLTLFKRPVALLEGGNFILNFRCILESVLSKDTASVSVPINIAEFTADNNGIYAQINVSAANLVIDQLSLSSIQKIVLKNYIQSIAGRKYPVYQGSLQNGSNTITDEKGLITFSFSSANINSGIDTDHINLQFVPSIIAVKPIYEFYTKKPGDGKVYFKIFSNVKFTISQVVCDGKNILTQDGSVFNQYNLNIESIFDLVSNKYSAEVSFDLGNTPFLYDWKLQFYLMRQGGLIERFFKPNDINFNSTFQAYQRINDSKLTFSHFD